MDPVHTANLPETWQFLGGMWWVLHIISILLVFLVGFFAGQAWASPEADPVDQEMMRRKEAEAKARDGSNSQNPG